jgi:hypothetical protein
LTAREQSISQRRQWAAKIHRERKLPLYRREAVDQIIGGSAQEEVSRTKLQGTPPPAIKECAIEDLRRSRHGPDVWFQAP